MKYVGSKRRILKEILPLILKERKDGQTFVDLMCGSAIIAQNVGHPVIANDVNPYLIELLRHVKGGTIFPQSISEESYIEWKSFYQILESNPSTTCSKSKMAMIGFVGFCCSYSGKFWGGYARGNNNDGTPRNFADEQSRNLAKRTPLLQHVDFRCCNYNKLYIPPCSLIYADPPSKNTTEYKVGKFDHDKFWNWCREKKLEGHTVFVSGYEAPEDFRCIWQKKIVSSLDKDTGGKMGLERLFTI